MTRAELIEALDAHVQTLLDLREPELRQTNATLRAKLERVTAERDFLRAKIDAETEVALERARTRQGTDTVTLAEILRVVRGYDSARSADTVGPVPRLHERIARSLLARMERP